MALGDPYIPKQEFPHICQWQEIEADLEDEDQQPELLRGKKRYQCIDRICRKIIWLRTKPVRLYPAHQHAAIDFTLASNLNYAARDKNYDEEQLRKEP